MVDDQIFPFDINFFFHFRPLTSVPFSGEWRALSQNLIMASMVRIELPH